MPYSLVCILGMYVSVKEGSIITIPDRHKIP